MSFIQPNFLLFFLVIFIVFYLCPKKYRYIVIFIGSYFFYGFSDPKLVLVLAGMTLITYTGGLVLENHKTRGVFAAFFALNIGILFLWKYAGFICSHLADIAGMAGIAIPSLESISIVAPIGLSFYVFQSTTYLSDIYRKGFVAEKNPIRYAAFVSFFPVILSGPIQKARELLPQLKNPSEFDSEACIRGFILLVWGFFEKVVIANNLKVIVDNGWNDFNTCTGLRAIIVAIAFSLYIYCDFSAYSDMACGISRMLGFKVKNNFRNPYLATSLAEFWNRWHITLNDWFIENVYIPLGGNRKGTLRKYVNVMAVFIFSGAWHGAAVHYMLWGAVNGVLQILGQVLRPYKKKAYSALHINDNCLSIRWLKRMGVFTIITFTWIFFRAPGTMDALEMINRIITVNLVDFFNPDILLISGDAAQTVFCLAVTVGFIVIQYLRKDGKLLIGFRRQPVLFQMATIGLALLVVIVASTSGAAEVNTEFIYFQF